MNTRSGVPPSGGIYLFFFLALALIASSASALTVRVDPTGGAPRLTVNGQPVRARIFFGISGRKTDVFASQIKLAAEVGVNIVSFTCPMPWPAPGPPEDWTGVDAACESVLKANPKALLLPRLGMGPPPWWRKAHPDDQMQWEDGRRDSATVASTRYVHDAYVRLQAVIRHIEEKFGDHVAGYHPCGQNTGEWFYMDSWKAPLSGYAPADLVSWQGWLNFKYGTEVSRNATLPSPAERHAAPAGVFRDPVKEKRLIDWAECQQVNMAECVNALARAARQASGGRKLVVFFYGYVFEFAALQNGPSIAGHYALRRVLNSPDIDVLCSPISYFDRGLGQGAPSMTAAESVARAGKLWLNEDDTHTYLATGDQPGSRDHVNTLEQTNAELARNVAQAATRNFATWWMDLGGTGWFNDRGMWELMKKLGTVDEEFLKTPTPFRPEVAAIVDERSMLRVAAGAAPVTRGCVYEARAALGRMGAPYGQYLLDELSREKSSEAKNSGVPPSGGIFSNTKLYVFLNAWVTSSGQRNKIAQATRGATRLWVYAPGCFDDECISTSAMRELTGFALKPVAPAKAMAIPTDAGKLLGLTKPYGLEKTVRPLFAAIDAQAGEVLARYPDGSAALALRRGPDGISIFSGAPALTSELLRLAARAAGVHLFTDTDCNVYANGSIIALHASQDGLVKLNTGLTEKMMDVMSHKEAGPGPTINLDFKRGETRIFHRE